MGKRKTFPTEEERFFQYIRREANGCWIWTKKARAQRQGIFVSNQKTMMAHHWSWQKWRGDKPPNSKILHTCGNLLCVNPEHLTIKTPLERFWEKVRKEENCWIWTASASKGYPRFAKNDTGSTTAYGYLWEKTHGKIPENHELHHRCENKLCVRPDHLQCVTTKEHIVHLSPNNLAYINSRKTHCKRGHEFTAENIYPRKDGGRECRACVKIRNTQKRSR